MFLFNKKLISFVAANLLMASSLSGLELKEATLEVLSTHPQILIKQKALNEAIEELKMTKAGYLPKLDLKSSIGNENTNVKALDNKTNSNTISHAAVLSQNIFEGFATDTELELRENRIKARAYSLIEQINDTTFGLTRTYLDVIRHFQILEIEKESVKSHEKIFSDVKKQLESGMGRISDLKEAASKLSLAYANLLSQENNYKDAITNFHRLLGRYEDASILKIPEFNYPLPQNLEEAIKNALIANPSIIVQKYEIEAARFESKIAKSAYYPKLDVELSAKSSKADDEQDYTQKYGAFLVLSYNLYKGGADKAKVQQTISATHGQIQATNELRRQTIEGMALSYNAHKSLERQIEYLGLYKESSQEKKKYYADEFELGRRSLMDLLDAEDDFNNARKKTIEAEFDYLFAKYRILDAQGSLVKSFGIDMIEELNIEGDVKTELDKEEYEYFTDADEFEDSADICQNSKLDGALKDGCENIPTIKEYDFLNIKESVTMQDVGNGSQFENSKQTLEDAVNMDDPKNMVIPVALKTENQVVDFVDTTNMQTAEGDLVKELEKTNTKSENIKDENIKKGAEQQKIAQTDEFQEVKTTVVPTTAPKSLSEILQDLGLEPSGNKNNKVANSDNIKPSQNVQNVQNAKVQKQDAKPKIQEQNGELAKTTQEQPNNTSNTSLKNNPSDITNIANKNTVQADLKNQDNFSQKQEQKQETIKFALSKKAKIRDSASIDSNIIHVLSEGFELKGILVNQEWFKIVSNDQRLNNLYVHSSNTLLDQANTNSSAEELKNFEAEATLFNKDIIEKAIELTNKNFPAQNVQNKKENIASNEAKSVNNIQSSISSGSNNEIKSENLISDNANNSQKGKFILLKKAKIRTQPGEQSASVYVISPGREIEGVVVNGEWVKITSGHKELNDLYIHISNVQKQN